LFSCTDEDPGPPVGPDTSWQIFCAENDVGCSTSQNPHGPLGGRNPDDTGDDEPIHVNECRFTGAGLQLKIEQPAIKADPAHKLVARARSVVEITNAEPDGNKCFVKVVEYPISGSPQQLPLRDTCKGNKGLDIEGTCTLTGAKNADGYGFNGTLKCDGMRVNGAGDPDYQLSAAREMMSPMVLQIVNCS
jgi:hypothetical protein